MNTARPEIAAARRKRLAGRLWSVMEDSSPRAASHVDLTKTRLTLPTIGALRAAWDSVQGERECPVPLEELRRDIERHELIHAAISPFKPDFPVGVNPFAGQFAEDLHVASFGQKVFGRFVALADFRIEHAKISDDVRRAMGEYHPMVQFNDALVVVGHIERGTFPSDDTLLFRVRDICLRSDLALCVFEGRKVGGRKWTRRAVRDLAQVITDICFPQPHVSEGPSGSKSPEERSVEDAEWIEHVLVTPELGERIPSAKTGTPRAAAEGMVPRYLSRYFTTRKVFAKVRPRDKVKPDAFLVDVSGSMEWDIGELTAALQSLSPRGLVVTYGSHGPRAYITQVAKSGRSIKPRESGEIYVDGFRGGNGCDGPALEYIGTQKGYGKRYWISDGEAFNGQRAQCRALCEQYGIVRIGPESMDSFLKKGGT